MHITKASELHIPCLPCCCFLSGCFSVYGASASIVYGVAAAAGTLYGSGMLQALYCIPTPLGAVVIPHMIDLWIDTLPSQVRYVFRHWGM